jgi:hypothetical protein
MRDSASDASIGNLHRPVDVLHPRIGTKPISIRAVHTRSRRLYPMQNHLVHIEMHGRSIYLHGGLHGLLPPTRAT